MDTIEISIPQDRVEAMLLREVNGQEARAGVEHRSGWRMPQRFNRLRIEQGVGRTEQADFQAGRPSFVHYADTPFRFVLFYDPERNGPTVNPEPAPGFWRRVVMAVELVMKWNPGASSDADIDHDEFGMPEPMRHPPTPPRRGRISNVNGPAPAGERPEPPPAPPPRRDPRYPSGNNGPAPAGMVPSAPTAPPPVVGPDGPKRERVPA